MNWKVLEYVPLLLDRMAADIPGLHRSEKNGIKTAHSGSDKRSNRRTERSREPPKPPDNSLRYVRVKEWPRGTGSRAEPGREPTSPARVKGKRLNHWMTCQRTNSQHTLSLTIIM
jgi:hypothetical protein